MRNFPGKQDFFCRLSRQSSLYAFIILFQNVYTFLKYNKLTSLHVTLLSLSILLFFISILRVHSLRTRYELGEENKSENGEDPHYGR